MTELTHNLRSVLDDYHRHFAGGEFEKCGACRSIVDRLADREPLIDVGWLEQAMRALGPSEVECHLELPEHAAEWAPEIAREYAALAPDAKP